MQQTAHSSRGFTLIELMIVVAIIAILAAIAVPAYQNYLIRAQVAEGISLTSAAETTIWDYVASNGTYPTDNLTAGLPAAASISGHYVSQVSVSSGQIAVSYGGPQANSAISNDLLVLSPVTTSGSIAWNCSSHSTIPGEYLPTTCR
jgi:type IV pilus assembly protein PilA